MTLCLFYAAVENPVLRVDHVWEVFYRRGSGIKYPKPYGMGRVMRLGLDFGWIHPIDKPAGTGRTRSNHNDRGTLTYRSEIFDPGKRVDSCLSGGVPTMQLDLPMLTAA